MANENKPYLTYGVVKKRADLSYDEFKAYWKDVHAPIAAKMPGVTKYLQNHTIVVDGAGSTGGEPGYDGIVFLEFESKEAHDAAWETPEGVATLADVPNFLEEVRFEAVDSHTII
jgi:uncharacterized protein (TIGR02118 family)